ncbi:MAG: hypothetical protein CMJ67_10725 [Planctomycetaceae bacterium]|nr:hypothetical protein [Planctomycetaceae bacterium]
MTTFLKGSLVRVDAPADMWIPVHGNVRLRPKAMISLEDRVGKVVYSDDCETEVEFEIGFIKLRCWFPNRDLTPEPRRPSPMETDP